MTANAKTGYKGKVKIGGVVIAGIANWSVTGAARIFEDDSEFGDEFKSYVPCQIEGGEVTLTGHYVLDSDEGQQLMISLFKSAAEITDLELYFDLDGNEYLTPDNTTDPYSYVQVAKEPDYGLDKAGLGTVSITFKVTGMMKPNATTTTVGVETHGAIDVADTTATLLGELTGLGEEASVNAYFEYGVTTGYGTDTSGAQTTMTAVGLFDNDLTGLSSGTTYHARAVILLDDETKVYGKDVTFVTAS